MSSRLSSKKKKEPSIIDVWLQDHHCHGCAIEELVMKYPPPYRVFSRIGDWFKFKRVINGYYPDISLEPANRLMWKIWNKLNPIEGRVIGKIFKKFVETLNGPANN